MELVFLYFPGRAKYFGVDYKVTCFLNLIVSSNSISSTKAVIFPFSRRRRLHNLNSRIELIRLTEFVWHFLVVRKLRRSSLQSETRIPILYIRERYRYTPFVLLFTRFFRSKVLLEVNGDAQAELSNNFVRFAVEISRRISLLSKPVIITPVESTLKMNKQNSFEEVRELVIPNPLCAPSRVIKCRIFDEPHLVFFGTGQRDWYGLDILYMIADSLRDFRFSVIGVAKNMNPSPNLNFFDPMSNNEIDQFLLTVDIGLASLDLEKSGNEIGSSIKVSKYIERCIPVISAHRDNRISEFSPVYRIVDFRNSSIKQSIKQIQIYTENWASNPPKYEHFQSVWEHYKNNSDPMDIITRELEK